MPRPRTIRFTVELHRPSTPKGAAWTFLVIPARASAQLPTRSMVTVAGTLEGQPLRATLRPDGRGGHWLRVGRALREKAGVAAGDTVALEIAPVEQEPEARVPPDLRAALAANPAAKATWSDITAVARRDWVCWITSGKKAETRVKRIATACDMLACGKRRACCFDRSGIYSKSLRAPEAAESCQPTIELPRSPEQRLDRAPEVPSRHRQPLQQRMRPRRIQGRERSR